MPAENVIKVVLMMVALAAILGGSVQRFAPFITCFCYSLALGLVTAAWTEIRMGLAATLSVVALWIWALSFDYRNGLRLLAMFENDWQYLLVYSAFCFFTTVLFVDLGRKICHKPS